MSGAIRVLLPAHASHLASTVLEAGCVPIIDATGAHPPHVPAGAWVRTRPGRPAPGSGPVVLAEWGAPVPDRENWLETSAARDVPPGFVGLILKGREAGGSCGEDNGLDMLARCPDPSHVLLDAGLGPNTAAAAAALGAAGVLLVEQHLACPELGLPSGLLGRLSLADDEVTHVIDGLRVSNAPTAPVLRRLLGGESPWALAEGLYESGDPREHLFLAGQGLALALELAERHGSLAGLLQAYRDAWRRWPEAVQRATVAGTSRPVSSAAELRNPGTAATTIGVVGTGVLWQEAVWMGRAVHGGNLPAALATGAAIATDSAAIETGRAALLELAKDQGLPTEPAPLSPAAQPASAAQPAPAPVSASAPPRPEPEAPPAVAIIGMGCRMPGANHLDAFWDNIVNGVCSISEVPSHKWRKELYFDADRSTPDKTYSAIGGFLTDFEFHPKRFRIPPKVAKQIDAVQQITLESVADALVDANLQTDKRDKVGRPFDRERCAVILGNALGGEVKDKYALRVGWPEMADKLRQSAAFAELPADKREGFIAELEVAYKEGLPTIDEDSMPGELSNVIAGRITNAFDLRGANYTVDAACASSMAAVQNAIKGLQDGDYDIVITGGSDVSMNIATYVKFCKIGALSPDHSVPFDKRANGFVMGEGAGILILKRYEDAIAEGDRIYAVIRGVGASSDGKGKGITAPNIKGQLLALERAYAAAGIPPESVDLLECHGTSTVVGDQVEVNAISQVIGSGKREGRGPIRIGSVKSNIGHLKAAAGAAAIIKAAKALHTATLPPSAGFENGREDVPFDTVPLQVQTQAEPWPLPPNGLRRAGVSAFGFGGTNFHIVLESYAGQVLPASIPQAPPEPQPMPKAPPVAPAPAVAAPAPTPAAPAPAPVISTEPPPSRLSAEPIIELPEGIWATSAMDTQTLLDNLQALKEGKVAPWNPSDPLRISAAAKDNVEKIKQLDRAIKVVTKGSNPEMLRARAIYYENAPSDGKLCALFTGQGSQYLDMGLDLAAEYSVVQDTFDEADRILEPVLGKPITDFIRLYEGEDAKAKELVLRQTEYSQPATLTVDVAILRLLASFGIYPEMVAGHSLGEYGAAVAAGIMTFEQALRAVSARGREMANIRIDDPGKMAGVATSADVVEQVLAEVPGYVVAANKNCPSQTVIAGASAAVEESIERFRARGITVYPLPVSHAFHSSIVAPASEPLKAVLGRMGLKAPVKPITTNVTAEYYPTDEGAVDQVIHTLAAQISAPVEWTAQIERMYDDGARIFIECGPKRALCGFVVSILKRKPHRAFYTNHPKRGGVWSFRDSLAGMLVSGFPVRAQPAPGMPNLFAVSEPRKATTEAVTARMALVDDATEAIPHVREGILRIVAAKTGYDVAELDLSHELEADLGIDTVKQAEIFAVVRETYGIRRDPDFSFADHRTLDSVIRWAATRIGATRPLMPEVTHTATSPVVSDEAVAEFLAQAARHGMSHADGEVFAQALMPAVQALLSTAFDAARASIPAPAPVAKAPAPVAKAPAPAPAATPPVATSSAPTPVVGRHVEQFGGYRRDPDDMRIVVSGASVGLPGGESVFGHDNLVRILQGENRISHIGKLAEDFLPLNLVRLQKDPRTGKGSFEPVNTIDQVIRLAGRAAEFDVTEFGVSANMALAMDITTTLAIAAGVEALRDAGVPLQRIYKRSASGKRVPGPWLLPEAWRDTTGVIFASSFPGYDQMTRNVKSRGDNGDGQFDRRFIFQILAMGHSQFAQFIGARGPNTHLNHACASHTAAVSVAEDWMRMGRCDRVIVVSADNVTSDELLLYIGAGFTAAGASSTHDVIEETALPFDRRRAGLILGMGAAAYVMERKRDVEARGVVPLSELLDATTVNSAYHGTRLDPSHIASVVRGSVTRACQTAGISNEEMARNGVFMSHETYTPARGGSSVAEADAMTAAFGDHARHLAVANTKGYTGHAMGAGIEDTIVLKAMQYGVIPPMANWREPDENLAALTIDPNIQFRRCAYGLRLAAGFGSQLAFTVWRNIAQDDERVVDEALRATWLRTITGYDHVEEYLDGRTLRVREANADTLVPMLPTFSPAVHIPRTPSAPKPKYAPVPVPVPVPVPAPVSVSSPVPVPAPVPDMAAPASTAPASSAILSELMHVIAEKTGYDTDELETDFELEADLGIDTVKQAEIFAEFREKYGLDRDDDFSFADYNTIEKLAAYLTTAIQSGSPSPSGSPVPAPVPAPVPDTTLAPAPAPSAILSELMHVIAEKTGYDTDELETDFELEADLGIDTVKQAEIFAEFREKYGLERDDDFSFADYETIDKLAAYLSDAIEARGTPSSAPAPVPDTTPALVPASEQEPELAPDPAPAPAPELADAPAPTPAAPLAPAPAPGAILSELMHVIAEKTGYDTDELETDFELEADLGIDTVKQAEIFAEFREKYGLERDDDFSFADYETIDKLAAYLSDAIQTRGTSSPASSPVPVPDTTPALVPASEPEPELASDPEPKLAPEPTPAAPLAPAPAPGAILSELMHVIAEKTGYETDELETDFELEADLGIDTVKQAEIFAEFREKYGLQRDDEFSFADYETIDKLAAYLTDAIETRGDAPAPDPELTHETEEAVAAEYSDEPPSTFHAEEFDLSVDEDEPASTTPESPESPAWTLAPLPDSFRVRRPVLVPQQRIAEPAVAGKRVLVVGQGPLATAIRMAVELADGVLDAPYDAVIDASSDPLDSFAAAKQLSDAHPASWLAVTRLGGFDAEVPADVACAGGSIAGFAKAIGREWDDTQGRVLDVSPADDDIAAAQQAIAELFEPGTANEVFVQGRFRKVVAYRVEEAPAPGAPASGSVVLITGGGRGITAQVAMELARRGPITLALVGRGPMAESDIDLVAEKARIKDELKAAGGRVRPVAVDNALKPLRKALELRQNVLAMRALGAEVSYHRCNMADGSAVAELVREVQAQHGAITLCIHGAGVEESRLVPDKDVEAFKRVYDGKALGGLALVEALSNDAQFISMGSVSGRFGNAGQVDYSAANDAMARICHSRAQSLHIDWTAWDDVGMAVRGGMRRLLEDRGVDLLPADSGSTLLVDLIAAGATGELVVAGGLGDFFPAPDHPMLDRASLDGDTVRVHRELSAASDAWIADHAIDGTPVLPGVIGLELMAAAAGAAQPGQFYAGARDVRFAQPAKLHKGGSIDVTAEATPAGDGLVNCRLTSERTLRTGRKQVTEHFTAQIILGMAPELAPLPSTFLPDESVAKSAIYQRFFHGPGFQVLTQVQGISTDAMLAEGVIDSSAIAPRLLTDPLLLEAAFQAAGLHHMLVANEMGLPSHIDEVQVLGMCEPGERVTIMVHRVDGAYDVDVDGDAGPLLRLRGYSMAILGPLSPSDRFEEPEGGRPECLSPRAPRITAGRPAGAVAWSTPDDAPSDFLSADELTVLRARGTERRVNDRVLGRIAAKRAIHQLTGVAPSAFTIDSDPSGEPRVVGLDGVRVSISHREGRAVAMAVRTGRVGVDLEQVESRPDSFETEWFDAAERAVLRGDAQRVTVGWSAKEAVLKVIGKGMACSPRDVRIRAIEGSLVRVELTGDVAEHVARLGSNLRLHWQSAGAGQVLVSAVLAA